LVERDIEAPLGVILYLFAGQCGYPCALNNVKWVMKAGAVLVDKTKERNALSFELENAA
jgi:hypothetical protein